jgi:hypothetical protein
VSASKKGSLLIYSKIELRWNTAGQLIQDTVLELTNDLEADVYVQAYFVNGDEPLEPVYAGDPPMMVAEGEPGWNWVDWQFLLTANQPTYWSASTGLPAGAQPFDILDPDLGHGPGRLDPEGKSERVLRGFLYLWAVDAQGYEIRWNHLSGAATLVNYADETAWEYNAWAFQTHVTENALRTGTPGILNLDGIEYDLPYDMLLMDFYSSGSDALSASGSSVSVDTDLTLHPVSADLRQDTYGPVTTKAKFDIWNQNERRFSGTTRCITCWDQTLLSSYDAPNHFLIQYLQTDKGKARIDGMASDVCDHHCDNTASFDGWDGRICSQDAALLGVVSKVLTFEAKNRKARSGRSLVGMGTQPAVVSWDIISPPGDLRDAAYEAAGLLTPTREDDTRSEGVSRKMHSGRMNSKD